MIQKCSHCGTQFHNQVKFCTACGTALNKPKVAVKKSSLSIIITFYVIFLLYAVFAYFIQAETDANLSADILIEVIFAILVIGFCLIDYKGILRLYKLPKYNSKILLFSLLFPVFSSLTVYFSIEVVNNQIFEVEGSNYYIEYLYLEYPMLWAIIFIAILPPILEELAFRGFLFNELQKITSPRVTILATAFIFALVHFSFVSLLWIFPFGIVLGYVRHKYQTLWYSMLIHFIHNFIVLMLDYYALYYLRQKARKFNLRAFLY